MIRKNPGVHFVNGPQPIRALACPCVSGLAMYRTYKWSLSHILVLRATRTSCPSSREAGGRERPLHSSHSYGCIASRGGRGALPRSGGDLTPGEAMNSGGIRSDSPLTGGRIPGCAGAPALRLERVFRSRSASSRTCPRQLLHALLYLLRPCSRAPASRILVQYAG